MVAKTVTVSLSIDRALLHRIDRARNDVSRSRFVARILEKSIKEKDVEQ